MNTHTSPPEPTHDDVTADAELNDLADRAARAAAECGAEIVVTDEDGNTTVHRCISEPHGPELLHVLPAIVTAVDMGAPQ
jgi:hypothetical protein